MQHPIVIIGTGLAGYNVAKEFRKLDKETPLEIITDNDGSFYSKPLLSSAFTAGKTAQALAMFTSEAMAQQLNARIHTYTHVERIDYSSHCILTDKKNIHYSKLIIACGATVIKAPLAGNAADQVLTVNNLDDYAKFRASIHDKKTIAILGAGLIGCEFCNDLSNGGFTIHCIAKSQAPLDLLVPPEVEKLLQTALSEKGVHWHLNNSIASVDKVNEHFQLTLLNGETLNVDVVLSAIGIVPHTEFAKKSGLNVNRGIIVNRFLETSIENVYVLGDCAEVEGFVLPYVSPLLTCARALAKTLTGEKTAVTYPAMPIVIKTPAHPVAVTPPPRDVRGEWKIEENNNSVRALFYDENHVLRGFILTNAVVQERHELAKQIPGWL